MNFVITFNLYVIDIVGQSYNLTSDHTSKHYYAIIYCSFNSSFQAVSNHICLVVFLN